MALQPEVIIQVRERWSDKGFTILFSDKKTAYSIGFHEKGDLLIHACKIEDGQINFDHNPIRGIAIDLTRSTYESWGLFPKSMSTIYSLFKQPEEGTINTLRESFAEIEHIQWAHWTKYMLQNLSGENIIRWQKQVETPYKQLSDDEKESDRVWADKVLEVLLRR